MAGGSSIQLAPAFAPVHVANIRGTRPRPLLGRGDGLSRPGQLCRAMGPQRERQAVARRRDRQAARRIYAAAEGPDDHAARLSRRLCARAPASRTAGRSANRRRRAGRTSRIATEASASAATCRRTPAPAASFTRSSARRRASSTATSRWSAGWSTGIDRLSSLPRGTEAHRLLQGQGAICADREHPAGQRHPAGRASVISNIWTPPARPSPATCKLRANRHDDFYDPARGRRGPVQRAGAGAGRRPSAQAAGVEIAVLVLDDDRPVVRAHARLRQRQGRRAKGALGRDPADEPVSPARSPGNG